SASAKRVEAAWILGRQSLGVCSADNRALGIPWQSPYRYRPIWDPPSESLRPSIDIDSLVGGLFLTLIVALGWHFLTRPRRNAAGPGPRPDRVIAPPAEQPSTLDWSDSPVQGITIENHVPSGPPASRAGN